jgi:hypothetical protein
MSEVLAQFEEFTVVAENAIVHIIDAAQVIRCSMHFDEWHGLYESYKYYMERAQ